MEDLDGIRGILDEVEAKQRAIRRLNFEIEDLRQSLKLKITLRGGLTAQQTKVYALAKSGMCNKEIANSLNITVRTVKFHISSLLAIFQAQNRSQL